MKFFRKIMAVAAIVTLICFVGSMPVLAKSTSTESNKAKKETVEKKSSAKSKSSSKASKKKSSKSSKSSAKKLSGKININKADAEALTQLPGIGPVTAKEIIAYRKKHGSFKSVDDLMQVKGIGPKILQKIKKNVSLK